MVRIVIDFDETTGRVSVTSPIVSNKLLSYGILELAKEAVRTYKTSTLYKPKGAELSDTAITEAGEPVSRQKPTEGDTSHG